MNKGKILLVEDDPLFQHLIRRLLEREGYSACCLATSGEDAIRQVPGCRPDLVLMDINLDGDLNGIETAEHIHGLLDVPIVFLASITDETTIEHVQRAAPYGFISKPFASEQLIAAIETSLNRHRLDRQVESSRDWLSTVLGGVTDGVISVDMQGIVTFVNPAAATLLGDSCLGRPLHDVLNCESIDCLESGGATTHEARDDGDRDDLDRVITLTVADGSDRTLHIRSTSVETEDSTQIGAVVILRDVTEEERLLKELKGFKLAVDSMQIGVTMTDLDRKILYANRAEADMHGWEQHELLGRSARTLGAENVDESVEGRIDRPARWKRQRINTRSDGSTFPVLLFSDVVRDSQGNPAGLVTCCEDLTDRVRTEERIRKLNQAVEQSPALVIITDVEGNIEYVNPQFSATTGYSVDEAQGQNPRILKSEESSPEVYEDLWAAITQGQTWNGEFRNKKKDGAHYWAFASISGLRNEKGEIQHYVGVQVDITRRKEMEAQLEKQNAELEHLNRLKSEMVAITSHDLKSPLHAMVSIANLLKELGPELDDDAKAGFIDQIISSGQKLSTLISSILDAENIESEGIRLEMAPTCVEDVISGCVDTARAEGRAKGIKVTLTGNEPVPRIQGDPGRLEQVFNNLLTNAVKFSPENGNVHVSLQNEPEFVSISVGDEGPGIPEKDLENIFDRYFQVNSGGKVTARGYGGVGLGLFITRKLVEAHQGTVIAENRQGGGCVFTVRLPAIPSEETDVSRNDAPSEGKAP